jgi:hypothetical protein
VTEKPPDKFTVAQQTWPFAHVALSVQVRLTPPPIWPLLLPEPPLLLAPAWPPLLLDALPLLDVTPLEEDPSSTGPRPAPASSPLPAGAVPRTSRALRLQLTPSARTTIGSLVRRTPA